MPPGEASRRVGELVAAGFHEIVLCGIHLGLYGADLEPRSALADLVGRLSAAQGDFRIRLSSIEPMEATDALLERMAAGPQRLCPHLHLPLQSGDDEVLRRMGRPYTAAEFLGVIGRVRKTLPLAAITTDVMVGFPGETEGGFERTLAACRAAGFSRIHVFPFSRRPGTAAAGMSPQAPREVIRARRARAAALGDELAAAYRRGLVGREARVVVEKVSADGSAEGLCERYVRVRIRSPRVPSGAGCLARRQLISVRIAGAEGDCLIGELLGGENSAPIAGNSLHAGRPRVS
jgi:threonylcarbamoyladenosine tRNA methylthiotransferase MtaB